MKNRLFCISLLVALFAWAAEYKVGSAGPVLVDGVIDEPCWQAAVPAGDFRPLKSSGKSSALLKTSFKALADPENLYFAITCDDPGAFRADLKGPHSNPWSNDLVEIFLVPTGIGDEFYQFVISAGGASWQQFYGERGNIRPDAYAPAWEFSTRLIPGGWCLEVKIPLAALYMTSAAAWENTWLANVVRYSPGHQENSSWSSLNQNNHETDSFNKFSGLPAKPGASDLRIHSAVFKTTGRNAGGFPGTLETGITLNAAPEGEYLLETCGQTFKLRLKSGSNTFSSQVQLPMAGRNQVKFILRQANGKLVHERNFPVLVDASPLKLIFTSPQYSGNFYPGEDANRLQGFVEVNIPAEEITLEVAGTAHTLKVTGGKAGFDLDVSQIPGDIPVRTGEIVTTVRRITNAKAWIRNGRVIVNGKPEFLLGWYGGPGWICSKAFNEKYPSQADKHPFNLPGWIGLEVTRLLGNKIETEEMVYDRMPSQKVFDAVQAVIEKNRNSPQILYYLSDEPECRGVSTVYLRHLYEFCKKLDPARLVMIISREPVRYIDCADIINPHPYIGPVVNEKGERSLNKSIASVRDMCGTVERLQRPDKVLMLTPQTFCYSFNNFYADYPTFDETSASIWASVCCGGQGITPYIWYDHAARPDLSLGCDFIYTSLDRLSPLITSEHSERLGNQDIRVFKADGQTLYLLVNVQTEAQKFQFPAAEKVLYRFRDRGELVPENARLILELAP
ncbi:MAG: sugar-binding protein, partial [Lentisphaeria bacterium]